MGVEESEHALRAILYLAQHNGGIPVAADQVAEAPGAPRNDLSGVLDTRRGARGGFTLAIPVERRSVAEIVEIFDSLRKNPICLLGGP